MKRLPTPQGPAQKLEAIVYQGGLDLVTQPLKMPSGRLLECQNWDIPATGGYRRLPGYERYDGRTKPSTASAVLLQCTTTWDAGLAVGDSISGQTSLATGVVAYIVSGRTWMAVTKVVGAFDEGEVILEGATPRGTTAAFSASVDGNTTNEVGAAAADIYRADIAAPTGSGAVRGVWEFNSKRYAWRNNAGGTACVMYEATTSGWTAVTLAEEIYFTNANTSVAVGDTLTQGGVTAVIRKMAVQTGTLLSGVNTGKLTISGRAGGNYAAGAATSTGGGSLTLSAAQTAQAFPAGGKYRFRNTNFGGAAATYQMYGVNGVGKAFEFDGTYLMFIDTGMTADTPSHVAVFKQHLFLAFGASVQHSAPVEPFVWDVVIGAGELGAGDTVTNFNETTDALIVFCKNKTLALYGTGVGNWDFPVVLEKIGARTDTAQVVAQPVYLDDLGITTLTASQEYGNFAGDQVSELIKDYINTRIETANCSLVSRKDKQYQLFFSDGSGVRVTFSGRKVIGSMPFYFDVVANVACEGEDTGILLIGASNGMVYELNVGRNFDGEAINHRIRLAWNFSDTPRQRKTYKRTTFDVYAQGYGGFTVGFLAGRNDPEIDSGSASRTTTFTGGGGVGWDDPAVGWDAEFGFDGDGFTTCGNDLDVTATDIGFILSGQSDNQLAYTVSGQLIDYVPRRLRRKHS